jgi:hypothetical protein
MQETPLCSEAGVVLKRCGEIVSSLGVLKPYSALCLDRRVKPDKEPLALINQGVQLPAHKNKGRQSTAG